MILARLSGGPLEHTGLIRGMSGSPVYIDGRLIGAIAYGWYFSKEPIGGITPIAHMLDVATREHPAPSQYGKVLDLDEETTRLLGGEGVSTLAPLGMPIAVAGFSPRGRQVLRDALDAPGIQLLDSPIGQALSDQLRGVYRAWGLAGRAANPRRLQRSRDWHPYLGRRRAFCRLWASDVFAGGHQSACHRGLYPPSHSHSDRLLQAGDADRRNGGSAPRPPARDRRDAGRSAGHAASAGCPAVSGRRPRLPLRGAAPSRA